VQVDGFAKAGQSRVGPNGVKWEVAE